MSLSLKRVTMGDECLPDGVRTQWRMMVRRSIFFSPFFIWPISDNRENPPRPIDNSDVCTRVCVECVYVHKASGTADGRPVRLPVCHFLDSPVFSSSCLNKTWKRLREDACQAHWSVQCDKPHKGVLIYLLSAMNGVTFQLAHGVDRRHVQQT